MANDTIKPWERRHDESDVAWEAFVQYRDWITSHNENRSLVKVATALGKSRTLMERWCKRHEWTFRIVEFDRWQDQERLKALVKGQVQMRERHANVAAGITARLGRRIAQMTDEEISRLPTNEIAGLLKAAADVERQARAADIFDTQEAPFEVHIHTYAPGQEPEPMRALVNGNGAAA
jgi:hypothetical protein